MSPRLDPMLTPPIAFAAGGAGAQVEAHSAEAFELAVRLGATGLRSSLWTTADGALVVGEGSVTASPLRRRRPVRNLHSADLPARIATLDEFVERAGSSRALGLDVAEPHTFGALVEWGGRAEQRHGGSVLDRMWVAHDDLAVLTHWRRLHPSIRLVVVTSLGRLAAGPERLAADLSAAAIDAVRLPYGDWSGGLATLFHRFGVFAFADVVDHDRMLDELLRMGVDAVSSAHADRLTDALKRAGW